MGIAEKPRQRDLEAREVMTMASTPIAMTIAGSDSGGGAGIQADLKTMSALGVYGTTAICALTAQNTRGVQGVELVSPAFVVAQIDSILSDIDVRAAKTGMLANAAIVNAVADRMRQAPHIPLVVDPVMIATSGDSLLSSDAIDAVRHKLLPAARIVTPNLPEAAKLLSSSEARTPDEAIAQARALIRFGSRAVLVKGGHGSGSDVEDVLLDGDQLHVFRKPRLAATNTHGTGCTLSAAIASYLARGDDLPAAVEKAQDFVWNAIRAGQTLGVGHGHGPVDHLWMQRK